MNNLADIQSQIAKLQKQEKQIKTKEFAKTLKDIQVKMRAFGITVEDLQAAKEPRPAKAPKSPEMPGKKPRRAPNKLAGSKVPAKYRNAEGQSWTGRGLMPRWLKTLVDEGRTKEEFLVA